MASQLFSSLAGRPSASVLRLPPRCHHIHDPEGRGKVVFDELTRRVQYLVSGLRGDDPWLVCVDFLSRRTVSEPLPHNILNPKVHN